MLKLQVAHVGRKSASWRRRGSRAKRGERAGTSRAVAQNAEVQSSLDTSVGASSDRIHQRQLVGDVRRTLEGLEGPVRARGEEAVVRDDVLSWLGPLGTIDVVDGDPAFVRQLTMGEVDLQQSAAAREGIRASTMPVKSFMTRKRTQTLGSPPTRSSPGGPSDCRGRWPCGNHQVVDARVRPAPMSRSAVPHDSKNSRPRRTAGHTTSPSPEPGEQWQ